tara:strand:- start:13600 stop:14952 length:1353 start_codon:yes stop_codon:yes gene_type:complete
MTGSLYGYSQGDLLNTPLKYTYTTFQGEPFLAAWRAMRTATRGIIGEARAPVLGAEASSMPPHGEIVKTAALLEFLASPYGDAAASRHWLNWLIQRFEVSKRVHSAYTLSSGRVKGSGDYLNMELYLRLGEVLAGKSVSNGHLPALNALLKCLDTLCSQINRLNSDQKARLAWLIDAEERLVEAARPQIGSATKIQVDPPTQLESDLGTFDRVALLAADTMRSRGYAQALVAHGVELGRVVIIKVPDSALRWGQSDMAPSLDRSLDGYFLPDLSIPLEETCKALSNNVLIFETGSVNSAETIAALQKEAFDFTIYSGFGGELVNREVLERCPPLLHMHAGWLPEYRGSTTTFYSWLREGVCGVSAIFLSAEIDEGPILDRKRYPPPPPGMDSDYLHDAVLRSDLLLAVMAHLARTGALPKCMSQESDEGKTYYIIHPVLKHLAILSGKSW